MAARRQVFYRKIYGFFYSVVQNWQGHNFAMLKQCWYDIVSTLHYQLEGSC